MKINKLLVLTGIVFTFSLLSISSADAVSYTTGCGERFSIGTCWGVECATCCEGSGEEMVCYPCCPCCTECSCYGSWNEYRANTSGCRPEIQVRTCESVCGPAEECCGCGPCQVECTSPEICRVYGSWQAGSNSCAATSWSLSIPSQKCTPSCIDAPSNPRYYDNPEYPTDTCNPEEGKDPDNIYLPVKLDWDDVRGWKDGWKEGNTCPKTCSASCPDGCYYPEECYLESQCVHSYVITIEGAEMMYSDGATTTKHVEVLDDSEFQQPNSCFFKSGETYTWKVKACCDSEGKSCGKESTWTFTTSRSPEPQFPYDADWAGDGVATGTIFEDLELRWCTTTFLQEEKEVLPMSFRVGLFAIENGKEICHPEFLVNGICTAQTLRPNLSIELFPEPKLSNEKYDLFTKDITYAWQLSACEDFSSNDCTNFGQKWRFSTEDFELESGPAYPPNDPNGQNPVGMPVTLRWGSPPGAKSFYYEISGKGKVFSGGASASLDYPTLGINTLYKWRTLACWDYEGKNCEDSWSDYFYFKTTGQPPETASPKGNNIEIPAQFEWKEVSGARSYVLKINAEKAITETVEGTTFQLNYPDLKQETTYTWQVKSCARTGGNACGPYSALQSFTTFKLSPPGNPSPENNGQFFTYQKNQVLSWDRVLGGVFYQYEVNLISVSSQETSSGCNTGQIIPQTVTNIPNSSSLNLSCLGDYQWKVRACLDKDCSDAGDWSPEWRFSFVSKEEEERDTSGGLVPCGRTEDNPDTFWNEREQCQIKHAFLLIRNIIDFLLWQIAPLLLALMIMATGVMFYLSIRFQDPLFLTRIKMMWKAVGIGYGIIFLSWTVLNIFLGLIGFEVGIFGTWWQVGF